MISWSGQAAQAMRSRRRGIEDGVFLVYAENIGGVGATYEAETTRSSRRSIESGSFLVGVEYVAAARTTPSRRRGIGGGARRGRVEGVMVGFVVSAGRCRRAPPVVASHTATQGCYPGCCGWVIPAMGDRDRDTLLVRAGYRCEYCRSQLSFFEIDHILPQAARGSPDPVNRAIACPTCNRNKADRTMAVDPVTGRRVCLFNPRVDRWQDHFRFLDGSAVGTTSKGRATAHLLFRPLTQQLPADLDWWPIRRIRDATLHAFLNHQRARRLSNRFAELFHALARTDVLAEVSPQDRHHALAAIRLLQAETLFTRSRPTDVVKGLVLVEAMLKRTRDNAALGRELLSIHSILLQQLATVLDLQGEELAARRVQGLALRSYRAHLAMRPNGPMGLHERLRAEALAAKHVRADHPPPARGDFRRAVEQAKGGEIRSLTYIADVELAAARPSNLLEPILVAVSETLLACGYGQAFDYARTIVLRRRWWPLQLAFGERPHLALLAQDLAFWRRIGMENEIRELAGALRRLRSVAASSKLDEAIELVDGHLPGKR